MEMKRLVTVGENVFVAFEGTKAFFADEDGKEKEVSVKTILFFKNGFMVRQYSEDGVGGYGHPSKNFWTVEVQEREGRIGLLLSRGEEEWNCEVKKEDGAKEKRIYLFHCESVFVPLSLIRCGVAEVKTEEKK